ncbi:MAG TPA: hypothetical protein DIU00_00810 [Phycisphaerales bacterium]|nr:hypothetical protein [Phycisphaerales bacterium]
MARDSPILLQAGDTSAQYAQSKFGSARSFRPNSTARSSMFMNIITPAFDMAKAVEVFMQKAKRFFYSVILFGHRCPKCTG